MASDFRVSVFRFSDFAMYVLKATAVWSGVRGGLRVCGATTRRPRCHTTKPDYPALHLCSANCKR